MSWSQPILRFGSEMLFVIAMTLLVAGCSLAIAAAGGIVERRRPFTLLRVAGTATPVLRRVVLLESVLPLAVATIVAAVTGFGRRSRSRTSWPATPTTSLFRAGCTT